MAAERQSPGGTELRRSRPPWAEDRGEFEALYREHGRAVRDVAARVGGSASADDITQETFVQLWRNPHRFDPARGSIRAYLLTMSRNLTIDRIRSEAARSARELRVACAPTRPVADPAGALLQTEEGALVAAALARLSPGCRDAIVVAFYGEVSYREAAEVLGAPEGTIKSRIRNGLRQLRAELDASGGRPDAEGAMSPR